MVALGGDGLGIGGDSRLAGLLAQGGQAVVVEAPGYTLRKIDAVAIVGDIAVLLVGNHLGDAAHVKAHTRRAARHGLDNGVGQVVL